MLSLLAMLTGNMNWVYGLLVVLPTLFLIGNPSALLVITLMLHASMLTFPGAPENMNLFLASALLLTVAAIARQVLRPRAFPAMGASEWCALSLSGVLLLTASIRGFGLRMFGGEGWGGAVYVQLTIGVAMLLAARSVSMTLVQWRYALYGLCVFSVIPTAAYAINAASGGSFSDSLSLFISFSGGAQSYLRGIETGNELTRLQIANVSSMYVFLLALLLLGELRSRRFAAGLAILVALVLCGISGHRISLVYTLLLFFIYALLDARRPFIARLRNPMIWGTVVVVALLGLLAPYLPSAFQRALTWIPFAHVSDITSADAEGTSLWRFELWRMLLREAPQYLWVGKGYVFSFSEYASIFSTSTANQYESFIITHNYHNGLLSLLIDLGLPGLVIGLGYIAAVAVRETRRLYYVWPNTVLHNYHRIVLAAFLAQAIVFVGFAGGVQSFMSLFVLALIADGLFHSAQKTPPTKH